MIHPLDRRVRREELAARPEFPLDSPHTRVGKGAHLILRRACPLKGARLEGLRAVPKRTAAVPTRVGGQACTDV